MDAGRESLGLDTTELKRWLKLYDLERYLFRKCLRGVGGNTP